MKSNRLPISNVGVLRWTDRPPTPPDDWASASFAESTPEELAAVSAAITAQMSKARHAAIALAALPPSQLRRLARCNPFARYIGHHIGLERARAQSSRIRSGWGRPVRAQRATQIGYFEAVAGGGGGPPPRPTTDTTTSTTPATTLVGGFFVSQKGVFDHGKFESPRAADNRQRGALRSSDDPADVARRAHSFDDYGPAGAGARTPRDSRAGDRTPRLKIVREHRPDPERQLAALETLLAMPAPSPMEIFPQGSARDEAAR